MICMQDKNTSTAFFTDFAFLTFDHTKHFRVVRAYYISIKRIASIIANR